MSAQNKSDKGFRIWDNASAKHMQARNAEFVLRSFLVSNSLTHRVYSVVGSLC